MNRREGYTLIFTLAVIALLTAVGAMLVGPSQTQQRSLELHYRKLQADFLSLGGIEQAKAWAAQGVLTNELFLLSNGVVDTNNSSHQQLVGLLNAPHTVKPTDSLGTELLRASCNGMAGEIMQDLSSKLP